MHDFILFPRASATHPEESPSNHTNKYSRVNEESPTRTLSAPMATTYGSVLPPSQTAEFGVDGDSGSPGSKREVRTSSGCLMAGPVAEILLFQQRQLTRRPGNRDGMSELAAAGNRICSVTADSNSGCNGEDASVGQMSGQWLLQNPV